MGNNVSPIDNPIVSLVAPIVVQQTISTHGLEVFNKLETELINQLLNVTEHMPSLDLANRLRISKRQLYDVIASVNTKTQQYFIGASRKYSDKGIYLIDVTDPKSFELMEKSLKAKEQHAHAQLTNVAKTRYHFEEVFFRKHGYTATPYLGKKLRE